MIFLGDIASPSAEYSRILRGSFEKSDDVFGGHAVVANLEGLVADISTNSETPILFNHPSTIEVLSAVGTKALSLANNHTLDIPEYYGQTIEVLKSHDIVGFGAGLSKEEAFSPQYFSVESHEFTILGNCWHVMLQHQKNPNKGLHVATLDEIRILRIIREERHKFPKRKIVLMLHWNLDLEKIPFPLHRVFARACIDAGASAVIGNHSHCVQGAERYRDGVIVYGLGNFFIPWGTYINGTIHFPDFTKISLALEWKVAQNDLVCHWFEYNNISHELNLLSSEPFESSSRLKDYTPYSRFGKTEYEKWFRKNRRKNFLVPIYKDHNRTFENSLKDIFLVNRIRVARKLAKLGLRAWNN